MRDKVNKIKELENQKKFSDISPLIDDVLSILQVLIKSAKEEDARENFRTLILSFRSKQAALKHRIVMQLEKTKVGKKLFECYFQKTRVGTNSKEGVDQTKGAPILNSSNSHSLQDFEIVDGSNINEMIKTNLALCDNALVEMKKEKNLILDYNSYFDELQRVKTFLKNLKKEGILSPNTENRSIKTKELEEKCEKYKKRMKEIKDYLLKKGYLTEQQMSKKKVV